MNWTLLPMPADEELTSGYIPPSPVSEQAPSNRFLRRLLIALLAVYSLAAGIQHAAAASEEPTTTASTHSA